MASDAALDIAEHDASPETAAPASLSELAYRRLEEDIVHMRLAPGSVVTEARLGERAGLGRTPVREAVQRLAQAGLLRILPRRGILISEIDVTSQISLLEVRREVERVVARGAARRADAAERAALRRIADEMDAAAAADDDVAFLRLDMAFNELTVAAARNPYAAKTMALMQSQSRRFWARHYREAADLPLCARLHADVARAIAGGDGDRAAAAHDRLMDYIESFTRATVTPLRRQARPGRPNHPIENRNRT